MNITTFGLDIAKNLMQVHWVDAQTGEVRRRALKRSQLAAFFARQSRCRIVLEACGSAATRDALGAAKERTAASRAVAAPSARGDLPCEDQKRVVATTTGTSALQCGGGGAGQQDGTHGLGAGGSWT